MFIIKALEKAKCKRCPLWHLRPDIQEDDKKMDDIAHALFYGVKSTILHRVSIDFKEKPKTKLYGYTWRCKAYIDEIITE